MSIQQPHPLLPFQQQPPLPHKQSNNLQSVTILLIFLLIVINQIFLISLIAILLKKIKLVIRSTAKQYYYFVIFYIASKMILCIFLQIKIITGIPDQFKEIQSQTIQRIFDNSLVFADCSILELFLISFQHYIALSFSVFGNRKVQRTVRILMQGVQLLTFFTLMIPLLLFNISVISYQTLNIFTMTLNCLSVILFITAFFFMSFKMTGVMMDNKSSQIIKKVYALLLALLISRSIMSFVEVWVQINLTKGSFEDYITIIEDNQNKYVVLGLCFIVYLVVMLLTEGLPLIMSLRESVATALTEVFKTPRSRSSFLEDSLLTDSAEIRQELFSNMDMVEQSENSPYLRSSKGKNKIMPQSYYGLSKIQDPQELEVVQKIHVVNEDFLTYKAKWTRNQKFYFVKKLGNISNYIVEEILNQIERYISLDLKVINHMKIIQNTNDNSVMIVEKYLPENLLIRMQKIYQSSLKQKIQLSIKVALAIKQFHDILKTGHGVLTPKNIMFDEEGNVHLTGFGMESLKKYLSLTTEYSNISMYTAVQLFGSARQKTISKPNKPSDIYSFGIIFYELVTGNLKYRSLTLPQIRAKFEKQNTRPKIPQTLQQNVKRIMRKCWQEKPESRPQIGWVITNLQAIKSNL